VQVSVSCTDFTRFKILELGKTQRGFFFSLKFIENGLLKTCRNH
jgi:hypothetical protein